MIPRRVKDTLPELEAFAHAIQARRPAEGTWCEAWAVRDVVITDDIVVTAGAEGTGIRLAPPEGSGY
ncbi:hypothetical protein [Streptomyces bugieae]|uniref:Uncharacterized protein n=1 Tax=Streptomyces bugieae TaxID=3098223 RepID=A0ABU7NH67_9ACTN|nr:hypothetical protein [Streptomyces sp. DSM 41528]